MSRYKDLDTNIKAKYMEMFDELLGIVEDERFDWDKKYNFCFESGLQSEMQELYIVKYYDPRGSYQDDVMAFFLAAKAACEDMGWLE